MKNKQLNETVKELMGMTLVDGVIGLTNKAEDCWGLIFKDNKGELHGFKYYPKKEILELCDFNIIKEYEGIE